jgi:hypothetical protein
MAAPLAYPVTPRGLAAKRDDLVDDDPREVVVAGALPAAAKCRIDARTVSPLVRSRPMCTHLSRIHPVSGPERRGVGQPGW